MVLGLIDPNQDPGKGATLLGTRVVREAIDRIGPLGRRAGLLHSSLLIVLTGLLLLLWLGRLRTPNIVLDDVPRIVQLQTVPLRARLFQPFNEHLAPWFQVVSTLTWELSGELAHSPLAFDLASYVPFLGCLGASGSYCVVS